MTTFVINEYSNGVALAKLPSPYPEYAYDNPTIYDDSFTYSIYVDNPILFNKVDRSNWLYQPNLVRWRSRYRGVRESLKVNQEIGQYYYDINILNLRQISVNQFLTTLLDDIVSGTEFQLIKYNWSTDTITTDTKVSLLGLDSLSSRVEGLKQRLKALEN